MQTTQIKGIQIVWKWGFDRWGFWQLAIEQEGLRQVGEGAFVLHQINIMYAHTA